MTRAHTPAGSQEVSVRQQSIRGGANTSELGRVSRSEGGEIRRSTCQTIRQGFRKRWGSAIVWDMLQGSALACPTVQKPLLESMTKSHLLSPPRKQSQQKYGKVSAIRYWIKPVCCHIVWTSGVLTSLGEGICCSVFLDAHRPGGQVLLLINLQCKNRK